jgi:3-isopropylmalate dehydrogenase
MLRYGLNQPEAATKVEQAVNAVLEKGYRTGDILSAGTQLVDCREMGEALLQNLES